MKRRTCFRTYVCVFSLFLITIAILLMPGARAFNVYIDAGHGGTDPDV